ncbi:succinate-semialdehyde dehydrogenase / glutarate-semialdehyde dehydrogenase [Marininema mesophilum]|uniref:Succinate-semialdehyde dehydrogenase / glutarate-semialdehyde dehydrogenase n=1 Tax=Marininema mesophilum TaxID=1048340 RepID=A0A1H2WE34_9BACL|nr:NAD-dependent succinate-semialdehyde dehydrogenase [Marininema mesophilum]SDW78289.1 succinate-semialdehyde dehydrogenase / glutarate-semialdehyde dehydrogenase [Marininema mesophilum]
MLVHAWKDEASCWINGERQTSSEKLEVVDPATGESVSEVPWGGTEMAEKAVEAAWSAFPEWSNRLPHERAEVLKEWAAGIRHNKNSLAELLSREQGKPVAEALGEIEVAASFVEWYGEEAKRLGGEVLPPGKRGQQITVLHRPVGVAALITPWNYPAAMVTRKVAPALAAGCTVVIKPASETPLIAAALIQLLIETELPSGVANLVIGDAKLIGKTWLEDHRVRKISFTGSTAVGKELMRQGADQMKRLSLELGGNAPAIVFDDVDCDRVADAIVDNKFENCGQMCNGINLIYAQESVREELEEKIRSRVAKIMVGRGTDKKSQMGPLINQAAQEKVAFFVEDAVNKGARLLCGGEKLTTGEYADGFFYSPTVLAGVESGMALTEEEVFGPVAPILSFQSESEVIERSNRTPYGLAAYLFTNDARRIKRVSEALDFGMIGVNGTSLSFPQSPFGGVKESGVGREGGRYGLEEFLELKSILTMLD